MGLDIYAGTLTRYYSHNWKNKVQQIAEANGQKCVMTDGLGNEIKPVEDKAEIMEVRDIICQWTEKLAAGLEQIGEPMPHPLWDEINERDYFTDKPDWEAFGALVMLQACHLQGCPLPEYVENGWSAFDEPIVKKSMSQKTDISLLSEVAHWLPIEDKAMFTINLPTGVEARVSTLPLLKQELEELNRRIWRADEHTILSWRDDKYYFPVKQKESKPLFGFLLRKKQGVKYRTEELAQCAFSMLYQAVNFAIEHKVPLLLDY
ncbi:hypothetical protein [uncultured Duncaniella sp.]|uniref:hypothetical protein n=1 Tax=uncultured Duncaniella sp. TaxID=2768039 RepID=UPI0025CCE695|nr:hypothetical protein [uncultured Duncaniella sp.]